MKAEITPNLNNRKRNGENLKYFKTVIVIIVDAPETGTDTELSW